MIKKGFGKLVNLVSESYDVINDPWCYRPAT
jgi:hypothetical protein